MNKRSGFRTGSQALTAGYGVTITNGVAAVNLTTVTGALGMNTTLTTQLATMVSLTLGVGTWLVIANLGTDATTAPQISGADTEGQIVVGTATATIAKGNSAFDATIGYDASVNSFATGNCTAIVTVTVSGTILWQALRGLGGGSVIALATGTGMIAVRIA